MKSGRRTVESVPERIERGQRREFLDVNQRGEEEFGNVSSELIVLS